MKRVAATFVSGNDWTGLYVDGVLRVQSHDLSISELAHVMKGELFTLRARFLNEAGVDIVEERGVLPTQLSDIPEEHFWIYAEPWPD